MQWNVKDMRVLDAEVVVNNISCQRLSVPRSGGRWEGYLDVVPERGWIPCRWETRLDGKASSIVMIEYVEDKECGPIPAKWTFHHFGRGVADSDWILTGEVTSYVINETIDDSTFEIQFPIGTHVVEENREERRYFKQESGGLKQMEENEYGRVPGDDNL